MQLWQYCLLVTAKSLYMFRTLSASIIRSTKTVVATTGACHRSRWYISSKVGCHCSGNRPWISLLVIYHPDP